MNKLRFALVLSAFGLSGVSLVFLASGSGSGSGSGANVSSQVQTDNSQGQNGNGQGGNGQGGNGQGQNGGGGSTPRISATEMNMLGLAAASILGTGIYLVRRSGKPRA